MRQYNRRYVHRGTRVETLMALFPNPLTRVELPNAPPRSVQSPPSGDQRTQPPTSGNGPPGHR